MKINKIIQISRLSSTRQRAQRHQTYRKHLKRKNPIFFLCHAYATSIPIESQITRMGDQFIVHVYTHVFACVAAVFTKQAFELYLRLYLHLLSPSNWVHMSLNCDWKQYGEFVCWHWPRLKWWTGVLMLLFTNYQLKMMRTAEIQMKQRFDHRSFKTAMIKSLFQLPTVLQVPSVNISNTLKISGHFQSIFWATLKQYIFYSMIDCLGDCGL